MKSIYYFILLASSTLVLGFISEWMLNSDSIIFNSLADKMTKSQLDELINFKNKWQLAVYSLAILFLLFKIFIISLILDAGLFFYNLKLRYKELFKIVVKAEFVFLLPIIFKTIWFYFFSQGFSMIDLQYFYPLSVINLVDYNNLEVWQAYPLQIINLFELAYLFILAILLSKKLKLKLFRGFMIVLVSYFTSLMIWVVSVMFFYLSTT